MRKDDNQAPNDKSLQCPAWFPHACVTVVSGQGNSPILSRFSPSIKVLNCEAPCGLASVRNRGNSVDVVGSQAWCSRRQRACLDYDRCFVNDSLLIQCSSASRRVIACKTFSFERCESGIPPDSLPALPPLTLSPTVRPTSDLLGPIDINGNGYFRLVFYNHCLLIKEKLALSVLSFMFFVLLERSCQIGLITAAGVDNLMSLSLIECPLMVQTAVVGLIALATTALQRIAAVLTLLKHIIRNAIDGGQKTVCATFWEH